MFFIYNLFCSVLIILNNQISCESLESSPETSQESTKYLSSYLIHTPQCRIPIHPLFDRNTSALYTRFVHRDDPCHSKWNNAKYIRRVNKTWVEIGGDLMGFDGKLFHIHQDCFVKELYATRQFYGSRNERKIVSNLTEFPDWDIVEVRCGNTKKVVPLIPEKVPKKWELPKEFQKPIPVKDHKFPMNVLLIGIDAVSRLNFHRHLNRTVKFLETHNFQQFYGHHKVADNTIPNLFGMMLGQKDKEWKAKTRDGGTLDALPFIFKEYSNAGYLTTYVEDYPQCGIFNFHGNAGFRGKVPMDYYLRAANLAIVNDGVQYDGMCYGDEMEMEYYYEYILDQMSAFRTRSQNHLTWIHLAKASHEELNLCQYADLPISNLLTHIFSTNHHLNTMIILYSDHSIRIGSILETASGFHETRLPLLYVRVPDSAQLMDSSGEWMTSEKMRTNLEHNSRRLTSQMDIHATLRHVLYERPPNEEPYGKSLFEPISQNRTCDQAGIPPEYCLCYSETQKYNPNDTIIHQVAHHIFSIINQEHESYKDKCMTLELGEIIKVQSMALDWSATKVPVNLVMSAASPADEVHYDVTVMANLTNANASNFDPNSIEILGKIVRNDAYWKHSSCIDQEDVKPFCYCRKLPENLKNLPTTKAPSTVGYRIPQFLIPKVVNQELMKIWITYSFLLILGLIYWTCSKVYKYRKTRSKGRSQSFSKLQNM